MPKPSNSSVATVTLGGRTYPLVMERTCRTCQSPHREEIERAAVQGVTWSAIVKRLPDDAGLTARNISDHFGNQHLPLGAASARALVQRNAANLGEMMSEGVTAVVDYLEFAQTVVGRVNARILSGALEPTVGDGVRAAQLLSQQVESQPANRDVYARAFLIYCQLTQELVGPDVFRRLAQRLATHAELQGLIEEANLEV